MKQLLIDIIVCLAILAPSCTMLGFVIYHRPQELSAPYTPSPPIEIPAPEPESEPVMIEYQIA